ncbi:MAG TPA: glucoamylase family protein, partial [Acidobacteriaceae bacterium]|nr:glucoamylase family protein [Acidobacteriaceae bacterium]
VGISAAAGLAVGLPGMAQDQAPAQNQTSPQNETPTQNQTPTQQPANPSEEKTPKSEGEVAKKYPHPPGKFINRPMTQISTSMDLLLDDMENRGSAYFYEQAHPQTGLVRDHAPAVGLSDSRVASIAATGFGLSVLCIAAQRKYLPEAACEQRVETTLAFLLEQCPHVHGFLYHFLDIESGERLFESELSSIDTSLLLCGILLCRQYFDHNLRIKALATTLYERIDWQWMLNGSDTLSMGWLPESGFFKYRWDIYAEMLTMLLLAIGAPRNAIPPSAWNAVHRPVVEFGGIDYISGVAPLFIHQYAHAWCDFRNLRDQHANYFVNSIAATRAHQLFCLTLGRQYPWMDQNLWGITASESPTGYRVWGGPPEFGGIDGTIVPCATAGSLVFLPAECAHVLLSIRQKYGEKAWTRYGFIDAFHPQNDWYAEDQLGIDLGISVMMAENLRTGFAWNYFMRNPEITAAMQKVGFEQDLNPSYAF